MSPFEYTDYREFLADACRHPEAVRGFQAMLARAAGCIPIKESSIKS